MDYPEAQRFLGGISRSTLKMLIGSGQLRPVAIGRRRFIRVAALEQFIAERASDGAPSAA
jgi:excisionase family DNA binding protein